MLRNRVQGVSSADTRTSFEELASTDLRSLATFRIGLSLVLLGDLSHRLGDLRSHYTDQGVLPRADLWTDVTQPLAWSFHGLSGSSDLQLGLFGLSLSAAVALLLGFRTRAATWASFLLLVSLHHRNPLVLNGGDVLLRVLLFWALFLPIGARWSMDARWRPGSNTYTGAPLVALLLQVCLMYWTTAALKNDAAWRTEGTAIYYALSVGQFATPLTPLLLNYPFAMKALTFGTLALEAFGPFLAWVPIATGRFRLMAVTAFAGLHIGIGLVMAIGFFPWICLVAWTPFLPSSFWKSVGAYRLEGRTRPGAEFSPKVLRPTRRARATAIILIGYVAIWNAASVSPSRSQAAMLLATPGFALGLNQYWNMFAPRPLRGDGWWIAASTLVDGQQVDLMREGERVAWSRPEQIRERTPNFRWRKYLMNLIHWESSNARLHYARYLCRRWNGSNAQAEQIGAVEILYMREQTLSRGRAAPIRPQLLIRHSCEPKGR